MSAVKPATKILMPIFMVMALLLGACGEAPSSAATREDTQTRAAQLALGTLSLEGTDQAVNAQQAAELVPMWEILADLSISETAAAEELSATVQAIEASMTAEQLDAIGAMNVSEAEAASMSPAGVLPVAAIAGDEAKTEVAQEAMDPSLGGEMGRDMAGGMGGDVGGGMPPEPGQARVNSSPGGGAASTGLFQSVITLLQGKAQS
jgi:hypothetical protein